MDRKRAPSEVLALLEARNQGTAPLRAMLRKLAKNIATLKPPRRSEASFVPPGGEKIDYFLVQPKAKATGYLKPDHVIIIKTERGWEKARLIARQGEYLEGRG